MLADFRSITRARIPGHGGARDSLPRGRYYWASFCLLGSCGRTERVKGEQPSKGGRELVQGAAGALNPWCIVPQQENLLENVICIIIICIAILLETGHHYVQQKLENYRTGLDLRSQYGQVDAVDYSDLDEGLLSGGKHFLIFFFGSQAS